MARSSDLPYLALMGASALLGPLHRRVEGVAARRWTASAIGVAQICAVMGARHAWHALLAVALGALLVRTTRERHRHAVVGAAMMLYLSAFRLYTFHEYGAYVTPNIALMMLTCRVVGVAFETRSTALHYPDEDSAPVDPRFADIVHYAFCYVGLLSGPYSRYRTYDDFIRLPFSRVAAPGDRIRKLAAVGLSIWCFLAVCNAWPLRYMRTDEFAARSLLYKITYSAVQYQMFKLWMYVGLLASELICSSAGFGAYPVQCASRPTHGPTKGHRALQEISPLAECDFVTNSSVDVWCMQTCPWVTRYIMEYNKSVQYFMGVYVYKSLPKTRKLMAFRALITILICAFWHGLHIGFPMGMITVPLYVPTERLFMKIHKQLSGWRAFSLACFMYVAQMYFVGFGVTTFMLVEWQPIITYYVQVMFAPYILLAILHVVGTLAAKKCFD